MAFFYNGLLLALAIVLLQANEFRVSACPLKCECWDDTVQCPNQSLAWIPHMDKGTVTAHLGGNNIKNIKPGELKRYALMAHLYLNNNKLVTLHSKTFEGLRRLSVLYLNNNEINYLAGDVFDDTPYIQILLLDHNQLHNILPDTFVKLIALHLLDLESNNIQTVSESSFWGLPSLTTLGLANNPIICDCDVKWIVKSQIFLWERGGNMVISGTCAAPKVMIDKPIEHLDIEDLCQDPKIVHTPDNVEVIEGQTDVKFHCLAEGYPTPRVFWNINDRRMLLDDRTIMFRNGSIQLSNIKLSDAGNYTCVAENTKGKVNATATLTILTIPIFTKVPKDKVFVPRVQLNFECTAIGTPLPTIEWYKDGKQLYSNDHITLKNASQNLIIPHLTFDDSGLYLCRAINSQGMVEVTVNVKVENTVQSAPKIITKPIDTEAYRESTVQLPCEADGEPSPLVEWRKDGSRVIADSRIFITFIGSLIIKNLTSFDTGRYECSVHNELGRDTVSAFLTVKDRRLPGDEFVHIALTQAVRDIDQAIERTMKDLFENKKSSGISSLFSVIRYPNGPARELARAAEIYDRVLDTIRGYVKKGLNITDLESFNYLDVISAEHLELIAQLSGCTAHRIKKNCSDLCFHKKYRTIDGSCNNFKNPMWGASLTAFRRILLPIYENGFSEPVGWNKKIQYNGFSLPSPRKVSVDIISTEDISSDMTISHMTMQWGQWLDHDLDHSLPSVSSQTWDGVDCKKTCEYAAPCFPIDVPNDDPRIKNRRCIDFVRTSSVCGSGMTSVLFGKLQAREQINQLTSFIDASQVYGFEQSVADDLRDFTAPNGTLRVGPALPGQKALLPFTGINGMDCRRNIEESSLSCFVAGDIRANEQIGLAAMHTLWMREHNRLALQLKEINPFWDGDKIYQEARKIVGAQFQFITYDQWLPLIVGPKGMEMLGEYKEYDRNINPSVSNVFSTAALRFGHSLINPILQRLDENFETIPAGDLLLRDAFFSPWRLVHEGGIDPLLRGMFISPAKLKTPTQNLNSELTERLFQSAHAVALDLAAINIQRGRDHAIPSYTKWRAACNMTTVEVFDDLETEISDPNVRMKLKELYGSVHNIDVWVGGILEDQVEGGKVGPLFQCLLLEQFKRLRDGDRFWYENPTIFTEDQLDQIRQTSLARVLCDNGDNIDTISENVFLVPEEQDGLISCEDIPSIDLRFWVSCKHCDEEEHISLSKSKRSVQDIKESVNQRIRVLEPKDDNFKGTITHFQKRIKHLEDTCDKN